MRHHRPRGKIGLTSGIYAKGIDRQADLPIMPSRTTMNTETATLHPVVEGTDETQASDEQGNTDNDDRRSEA